MDGSTRQLLLAADRLGEWEYPLDGSATKWDEIEATIPSLEAILQVKLDIDRNVQDASFMTDVGLLDERYWDRETRTGALSYLFSFRFSNFAKLFTLHGCEWPQLDEFKLSQCFKVIQSKGFVYVAAEDLNDEYDGLNGAYNPVDNSTMRWWDRFFDYL